MAQAIVDINASDVMKTVTLEARVIGLKRMRLRLWLGLRLLVLAAAVIGCALEFELREGGSEKP